MDNKENATPKKRQRTENWLEEDKCLLKELVKERVFVLENKNTDTNTNKKKQAAWTDLQLNFNLLCKGAKRSTQQLKAQWSITKMTVKKEKAAERRAIVKTGGGPPPKKPDEDPDDISSWLPYEFTVDTNDFDSDAQIMLEVVKKQDGSASPSPLAILTEPSTLQAPEIQTCKALLPDLHEQQPAVSSVLNMDVVMESDIETVETQHLVTENVEIECKSPCSSPPPNTSNKKQKLDSNQKRKKKTKKEVSHPAGNTNEKIASIANVEIECRKELHKIQMENEKKKARNLDLKHEVLKEKLQYYKLKVSKIN